MPYGMKKGPSNEWFFFNREYVPLGWNSNDKLESIFEDKPFGTLPVYTKYKGLTDAAILKIIKSPEFVQRDEEGKIARVFFYNDGTNPQSNPKYWDDYLAIIKKLSKFDVAR